MNPAELEAWTGHDDGRDGYIFTEYDNKNQTRTYRGKVDVYEQGPNVFANVLMLRKDIGPKP